MLTVKLAATPSTCSASRCRSSDWEPSAFETRAESISTCRKRSFGTYQDPRSVGGLAPPASYHSCATSSEEPPLANFNSQWNDLPHPFHLGLTVFEPPGPCRF